MTAILKHCSCGATYTAAQWATLRKRGTQLVPAGLGEPAYKMQLRDCGQCKSTLATTTEVYDEAAQAWALHGEVSV